MAYALRVRGGLRTTWYYNLWPRSGKNVKIGAFSLRSQTRQNDVLEIFFINWYDSSSEIEIRVLKSAHFIGQRGRGHPEIRISLDCHVVWYPGTWYPGTWYLATRTPPPRRSSNNSAAAQQQHSSSSTPSASSSTSSSSNDTFRTKSSEERRQDEYQHGIKSDTNRDHGNNAR